MPESHSDGPWAAVILAAGKGTRLGGGRAKVLREVAGRSMIAWILDAARDAGASRVVAVVGYDREAVVEALPQGVEWVVQEVPRGTGDAVRAVEGVLGDWPGDVWVLSGDVPGIGAETLRSESSARHTGTRTPRARS